MEDDEYRKLPPEEKCVHKLWKARLCGYDEVTKLFQQIDDDKSPEFSKYLGLIKHFVSDSNAAAQEKGLEGTLAFVENYALAGKIVGEVISGTIKKCIAANKARTRDLSLQIILMYIEIEKQDVVIEELIKGMDLKNPKIVCGCISACTTSLKEFGNKVITVKPLVKKLPTLFADRDKNVRDEARSLVIEIYKWIGPAIKSQLSTLQPVQLTELDGEFAKVEGQKMIPTRFIRSEQAKKAVMAIQNEDIEDDNEDDECDGPPVVDVYDLADPVDILSKLPKDFYDKLESKKWQERKEVLEMLDGLVKAPKLENGDYGDLIRALKKIIQKDSNIICVTLAGKCICQLATGLKKRFQTYSSACISPILDKFKEKKQSVVTIMKDTIDAVYLTTNIEAILEDVLEALANKNPSVKSETALFLARALTKTQSALINKKILKALCTGLLKIISESDPTVRDSTCEALGTLMKLMGEKAVLPFLVEVEKDSIKMTRIKECCEKAVITVKTASVKKERPATAPVAKAAPETTAKTSAAPSKNTKRSASATKKKPSAISSGTATIVKAKSKSKPAQQIEKELTEEEAQEKLQSIIQTDIINSLVDGNWKIRLEGIQNLLTTIQELEAASIPAQAFVKLINKKPGLKDTNFQVLNVRLDAIKYLAENCTFTITTADSCLNDVTEKLGDPKSGTKAGETLTAIAEAATLNHVSVQVIDFALNQKSPKVMQEAFLWLSNAIKEFGFLNLNAKTLIESSKKALASTNPAVRTSAIKLLGIVYMYMGHNLHMFFENEKPTLRDQIVAEFNKYENVKPPIPTRGIVKSESTGSFNEDIDEGGDAPVVNVQDLLPRVDISGQITESLITELSDKNWKVRNEALTKISNILSECKLIKSNLGDLPQALGARLVDSNTKIAQTAINICELLANAMGPSCKQHVRVFFPGLLQELGDSKAWIRTAAIAAINAFGDQCGYKEFFEGEMVFDALKSGSPTLRIELWIWLADKLSKLKSAPKEELMVCIQFLYTNLEDRNADVRKNAQEAVLGFMIHLSYETMVKQTEKLKPGSKGVVMGILEKVRPNLPVKPLPTKKTPVSEYKEEKTVKGTKPATNSKVVKPKAQTSAKSSSRKKEEDVDTSPLLSSNNLKQQRSIDESKMKVLKWNFTTPREEFVDLLKEQMSTANVNKSLIQNMFHADFRYHIKAIESLMEDLPKNEDALADNLDLILKWLTLRFFDTNPSVLLKGLEYLHSVFNMLTENEYKMPDTEAAAFVPYLVTKIGDPKDAVRNGVRSLFKQLWMVYSVSKIFSYLMDGLKSKNARQRAECLDVMGLIIDTFGLSVCLPNPNSCLKEIAKQISDRDNGVRNAALNCLVLVYYIENEKVYKMIGHISAKDMSLLEERIKRANKRPPNVAKVESVTVPLIAGQPINVQESAVTSSDNHMVQNDEEDSDNDDLPEVALPPQVMQEQHEPEREGPFQLDTNFMNELDCMIIKPTYSKLEKFNLDFLKEKIKVPTPEEVKSKVIELSPPKPILPKQVHSRSPLGSRVLSSKPHDLLLEKTINSIASLDYYTAIKACDEVGQILRTNKGDSIMDYENTLMTALATQLRNLQSKDPRSDENVTRMYRSIFTVIDCFYANKSFGRKLNADVIKSILKQLIWELCEGKLEGVSGGECYIRVANLQCVKMIERSDPTNLICGVLSLFHESLKLNAGPRLIDLVMKTLWKIIKVMPPWVNDINYDRVLLEMHNFLKEYPSVWWKDKSDTPLRTVKTILHTITKMKGESIMSHLYKIPNLKESEIEVYILRVLKTLKLDEVRQVPLRTDSRRSLSRSTHALLTDIFQKIGNKEETDEGLNLLYDFLEEHPEADIEPFIKRSSPFFQDYIQNNLKEIANARRLASIKTQYEPKVGTTTTTTSTISSTNVVNNSVSPTNPNNNTGNAKYWLERLRMWQQLWNDKMNKEDE